MDVKAKLRHLHIAPRKVRLVIDTIRGRKALDALRLLDFDRRRAAKPIAKLLKSAMANAEHNFNLTKETLVIKEIRADEGPKLKRWQPRAFGRAYPIMKRSSHISIILEAPDQATRKPEKKDVFPKEPIEKQKKIREQPVHGQGLTQKAEKAPRREGPAIWDVRRQGSGRQKQHGDKKRLAKQKGLQRLQKFFRRKSV